jgi:AcrR family transcriptional regulator
MSRTGKSRLSTRSTVRDRRAQRTRSEIVRAGLKVFAAKGFAAATMDDIALELDATKGLLYYHFKTKEEILTAILRQSPMIAALESELQGTSDAPLRQQIREAIINAQTLLENNRDFVRFLHVQAMLSTKEAEVVYHEVIDRLAKLVEEGIEHLKTAGQIRPEISSKHWARMMMSLVTSYFLDLQVFETLRKPDPEYIEHIIDTIVNAIATHPERR